MKVCDLIKILKTKNQELKIIVPLQEYEDHFNFLTSVKEGIFDDYGYFTEDKDEIGEEVIALIS